MKITKSYLRKLIRESLQEATPNYMSKSEDVPKIGDLEYVVYTGGGAGGALVEKHFASVEEAKAFIQKDQNALNKIVVMKIAQFIEEPV